MMIINAFKIRYRTKIVRKRIDALAYGDNAEINVLDAINLQPEQELVPNIPKSEGFLFNFLYFFLIH